jgi:hypothetical protein
VSGSHDRSVTARTTSRPTQQSRNRGRQTAQWDRDVASPHDTCLAARVCSQQMQQRRTNRGCRSGSRSVGRLKAVEHA